MSTVLTEEVNLLKEKNKPFWLDIIGSGFLFASSYLALYILYDYATAVTAAHFGLEPVLFFDTIKFNNNGAWYPRSVIITFSVGSVVMLVTGVGFYAAYQSVKRSSVLFRLSFIWLSLLSFVILAQRLVGVLFAKNFQFRDLDSKGLELAIVSAYNYFKSPAEFGLAVLGVVICILASLLFVKPFLQTASSVYQIDTPEYRRLFLRHYLFGPTVVGSILITGINFPGNVVPNSIALVMLFISLSTIHFAAMRFGTLIRKLSYAKYWSITAATIYLFVALFITSLLQYGINIPDPEIHGLFK